MIVFIFGNDDDNVQSRKLRKYELTCSPFWISASSFEIEEEKPLQAVIMQLTKQVKSVGTGGQAS